MENNKIEKQHNLSEDCNQGDTYGCLTKLALNPGKLETPGQIVLLGVPRILKICKNLMKCFTGQTEGMNEKTNSANKTQ